MRPVIVSYGFHFLCIQIQTQIQIQVSIVIVKIERYKLQTQIHNTIVQLPPQVIDLIFNLFLFPRFLSPFALVWGVPLLFSCFQFLWQLCFLVPLLGFVPPLFATWQLFREPCRIFSMGCRGPIWQRVFNGSFRLYFEFVFLLLSTAVSLVSCVYKCVSYESHRVLILECRFWNTCLCDSVSWMCSSVLNRCRLPIIPIVSKHMLERLCCVCVFLLFCPYLLIFSCVLVFWYSAVSLCFDIRLCPCVLIFRCRLWNTWGAKSPSCRFVT